MRRGARSARVATQLTRKGVANRAGSTPRINGSDDPGPPSQTWRQAPARSARPAFAPRQPARIARSPDRGRMEGAPAAPGDPDAPKLRLADAPPAWAGRPDYRSGRRIRH